MTPTQGHAYMFLYVCVYGSSLVKYLSYIQVLLVTLHSVGEVSQCGVDSAHIAQLASL